MAKIDKKYHRLLNKILTKGVEYDDPNRKGTQRIQIPSHQFKYDFKDGFPILTTKESYFKGAVGELLVFLSGSTDIRSLWKKGINFWDKDWRNFHQINDDTFELLKGPSKDIMPINEFLTQGSPYWLGKIYPYYMRNWTQGPTCNIPVSEESPTAFCSVHVDQIESLIDTLRSNPMATKKTVTMWNPAETSQACLTPCHWSFEALVEPLEEEVNGVKYGLTIKWHQHSVDTFLGLPINIMYYSLMCYVLAKMVNMEPKGVIGDLSNVHIYKPHMDAVNEQLSRDPNKYQKCELYINETTSKVLGGDKSLDEKLGFLNISDFELKNYQSYPKIKAEMLAYKK